MSKELYCNTACDQFYLSLDLSVYITGGLLSMNIDTSSHSRIYTSLHVLADILHSILFYYRFDNKK